MADKAGYTRENWKEVLCDPKLADAPETQACCEDGDLDHTRTLGDEHRKLLV